jgi:predicted NUDIX family NTP pyrophosphohydrolase
MVTSAGVLLFKREGDRPAVLLVHPGGPFWARRDLGAWSIPKGEMMEGEEPEAAARREFAEELGIAFEGPLSLLGEAAMARAKRVIVFAGEGHIDCAAIRSNSFEIEWPPKSGRRQSFPEVGSRANGSGSIRRATGCSRASMSSSTCWRGGSSG